MKEIPITTKNVLTFLLIIAMAAGFTWLYVHFSNTIYDEPAEEVVEFKYSNKGLYLFPRFEIIVSNSDRPSRVTQEQYESIQIGDSISGHMKNSDEFMTEKDIQFEKSLGIPIFIFLYSGVFLIGAGLLKGTKWIKNSETLQRRLNGLIKISVSIVLATYFLIGTVFVVLTATNIFNKMNTWNQTEVSAAVLGADTNETRSNRGASYTTYELFLHYEDEDGNEYITKKAVTGMTYNKYFFKDNIPLTYRNNNVYDTFIPAESIDEVLPAYFNLYTIFLGLYLLSLFGLIRAWRKKRQKGKEHDPSKYHEEKVRGMNDKFHLN